MYIDNGRSNGIKYLRYVATDVRMISGLLSIISCEVYP